MAEVQWKVHVFLRVFCSQDSERAEKLLRSLQFSTLDGTSSRRDSVRKGWRPWRPPLLETNLNSDLGREPNCTVSRVARHIVCDEKSAQACASLAGLEVQARAFPYRASKRPHAFSACGSL